MKYLRLFEEFVDENFDQAYNTKMLKNIKFILPSQDQTDDMFNKGDKFEIGFKPETDMQKINTDINKLKRKEKSVKAMNITSKKDEYGDNYIVVANGNYTGLTYLFSVLDKYYGPFGYSAGWMNWNKK